MTFDEVPRCLGKKKYLGTIYSDMKESVLEDFAEEASKISRESNYRNLNIPVH